MSFLAGIFAKVGVGMFRDALVMPVLQAYLKSKDVDLEKFKSANTSVTEMSAAVLDANVRFAEIKANYALAVLNWWPFRLILFALLFFPTVHFLAIVVDSTCPASWGLKIVQGKSVGSCGWGVPPVPDGVKDIYTQLLLFFVLAKPADTAISGAMTALNTWLRARK